MISLTGTESELLGYIIDSRTKDTINQYGVEYENRLSLFGRIRGKWFSRQKKGKLPDGTEYATYPPGESRHNFTQEEIKVLAGLVDDYIKTAKEFPYAKRLYEAMGIAEKLSKQITDEETKSGGLCTFAEHFPKAGETMPGKWCENGFSVNCEDGKVEIGVYREPKDNKEYAGTLTLQIYNGNDVIFCSKILED